MTRAMSTLSRSTGNSPVAGRHGDSAPPLPPRRPTAVCTCGAAGKPGSKPPLQLKEQKPLLAKLWGAKWFDKTFELNLLGPLSKLALYVTFARLLPDNDRARLQSA